MIFLLYFFNDVKINCKKSMDLLLPEFWEDSTAEFHPFESFFSYLSPSVENFFSSSPPIKLERFFSSTSFLEKGYEDTQADNHL
jgi:hypothetical protein